MGKEGGTSTPPPRYCRSLVPSGTSLALENPSLPGSRVRVLWAPGTTADTEDVPGMGVWGVCGHRGLLREVCSHGY